jgi:hypothetical protein
VCAVGYRADVLSTFFVLSAFLFYIRHREYAVSRRNVYLAMSLVCCLLGLFSKESAIILPVMIMAYDWYFSVEQPRRWRNLIKLKHVGFILITVFYLYVYFVVFRNTTFSDPYTPFTSLRHRIISIGQIMLIYFRDLTFPVLVDVIVPFYVPPVDSFSWPRVAVAVLIYSFLIYAVIKTFYPYKMFSFFLLWFLVSLIPISNIIVIPNAMAYRFLYLPSVGYLIFLAFLIQEIFSIRFFLEKLPKIGRIFKGSVAGFYFLMTFSQIPYWKNDAAMALAMIRAYPDNNMGHMFLGLALAKIGLLKEAKELLEKSKELGSIDLRVLYSLGLCYSGNDSEKAVQNFSEAINNYPHFTLPYVGLGREFLLYGKNPDAALPYLLKAVEQKSSSYSANAYLIQVYLLQNDIAKAREVLNAVRGKVVDRGQMRSLERFLEEYKTLNLPINIGI